LCLTLWSTQSISTILLKLLLSVSFAVLFLYSLFLSWCCLESYCILV
jgi:hypothetical protein